MLFPQAESELRVRHERMRPGTLGDPEPFARLGQRFLGPEISSVTGMSVPV